MTKKTVMEWLSWLKLENKKLSTKREKLEGKCFLIRLRDEKTSIDEEAIKSEWKSIQDIETNISRVKNKLTIFNATETVEVEGEKYPIAHALYLYKEEENETLRMFKRMYDKFILSKELKEKDSYKKMEEVERNFQNKANTSQKDKDYVIEKKKDFEVVEIDPIEIEKNYLKLKEKNDIFRESINTQINIKNCSSILEIELV